MIRWVNQFRQRMYPVPWLSAVCLFVLAIFTPYAMSFRPYPAYSSDPLFVSRVAFIILGFAATNVAFLELLVNCFKKRFDLLGSAPFVAASLACAVIGWRSFPYWVNGVYQARIGSYSWVDQDPKGLTLTGGWFGNGWTMSIYLLYLICYLVIPILVSVAAICFSKQRYASGLMTAAFTGIAATFMVVYSPGYIGWLLD